MGASEVPRELRPAGFANFATFHPTFLYESILVPDRGTDFDLRFEAKVMGTRKSLYAVHSPVLRGALRD
jgi:hypothetical protein